jgi:hypothetical protein
VRRIVAIVFAGAMLYATLHLVVDPSNLFAYRHGGVWFHTLAILSALVLPLALVPTARLGGTRWAPVLLLLVVIPVGMAGAAIARAGFAWLDPVSVIQEEIAKDPDSQIALAYKIARQNNTTPGRIGGWLHVFALLPALAMALVDARRRPHLATVAYAFALFLILASVLANRPAFAPLVPGALESTVALALTIAAALVSSTLAKRFSESLTG